MEEQALLFIALPCPVPQCPTLFYTALPCPDLF